MYQTGLVYIFFASDRQFGSSSLYQFILNVKTSRVKKKKNMLQLVRSEFCPLSKTGPVPQIMDHAQHYPVPRMYLH